MGSFILHEGFDLLPQLYINSPTPTLVHTKKQLIIQLFHSLK